MVEKNSLKLDVEELKQRIGDDGMLLRTSGGQPDLLTTAHGVPTLASVGLVEESITAMRALLQRRDEFGGWDEPENTIIALEALVALSFRKVNVPQSEGALDTAVKVLRDMRPLETPEWELRLARAIVLAGLATQQASVIDAGLLRVRTVLEGSPKWDEELSVRLHALLALTDLVAISKDPGTQQLLTSMLTTLGMIGGDGSWMHNITGETASRAGTILEKLGHHEQAMTAYDAAEKLNIRGSMTTTALKYRIELGVRLFGELSTEPEAQEDVDSEPGDTEKQVEESKPTELKIESPKPEFLPADATARTEAVSAIVVQRHRDEDVTVTLSALIRQELQPDQIVVVWADSDRQVRLPEYGGEWVEIRHGSSRGMEGWKLGLSAANGEWVWPIRAGADPGRSTLAVMLAASPEHEAVYLSRDRGELKRRIDDLVASPSLAPERCLLRRSKVNVLGHGQSFWDIAYQSLSSLQWTEKVEGDNSVIKEAPQTLESLATLAMELPRFHARHTAHSPEERQLRKKSIRKIREALYTGYQQESLPLVSILLNGTNGAESLKKSIRAIVNNTSSIPFEVIAVVNPTQDDSSITAMEHLGVLVIKSNAQNTAAAWNIAAKQAKGLELVLLDSTVEVEQGWLEPMLHAKQEEEDAGVAGALVQTGAMTVAHAGIAFHENGDPFRLHAGAPVVIPSIHRRRPFQAVAGGMVLIEGKLFRQVGGLDESLSRDSALVDLCLKSRQTGSRVVYEPKSRGVESGESHLGTDGLSQLRERWQGKVAGDLEVYARMDGYAVKGAGETLHLTPIGPTVKTKEEPKPEAILPKSTPQLDAAVHEEADYGKLATLLTRAELLMENGQYEVAERELTGGSHQVNGNAQARVLYWTLLGDSRFRLDKPEEAYDCYQKAVKDDPSAERAWIGIGTYHLVQGDLDQAEDIFSKVVGLNEESMRGHLGLGNVMLRRGQADSALTSFLDANRIDPGYRPTIVGLVAAAVQAEAMNDALTPLESYLELHPEDSEARFHYAAILFGGNEVEHAREEAQRVLIANPQHKGARELIDNMDQRTGSA